MNDDWRLQVDFHEPSHAQSLIERLEARELQHNLSDAFHDRVIVTRDDDRIFLYAGSREQAERARELVDSLAKQDGWNLGLDLKRWHPTAEDWEDPDKPLPHDDAARATEREALMATEREEAEERGYSEFEVRIDVPTRHEAIRLAERLREEGLSVARRWKFVLVGATDEDNAKELANRIENETPTGSHLHVEGTWKVAYAELPRSPFAILGGLAV